MDATDSRGKAARPTRGKLKSATSGNAEAKTRGTAMSPRREINTLVLDTLVMSGRAAGYTRLKRNARGIHEQEVGNATRDGSGKAVSEMYGGAESVARKYGTHATSWHVTAAMGRSVAPATC